MSSKFRTQYSKSVRFYSESGSQKEPKYQLVVDDNGKKVLKQTGETNTYEYIQSFKDSCALDVMIQKYLNGDENAFNRKAGGRFFDATKMPSSMVQVYQMTIDAENYFNGLPLEIRKEFGFDFGKWLNASDEELVNAYKVVAGDPVIDQKVDDVKVGEDNAE